MSQQTKTVSLNPGETKEIQFAFTPTVAKVYNVSVDGLSGSFKAVAPPAGNYLTMQASAGGTTNPAPGTYQYNAGQSVTLTATPSSGYVFNNWVLTPATGAIRYTAINPLSLAMDQDYTVAATFKPSNVTVRVRIKDYGPEAKYWVAMCEGIYEMVPVPITQEIVWRNVPSTAIMWPYGMLIVDILDGNPAYGTWGQSLRGQPGYPNLASGLGFARELKDGETIYWVANRGFLVDENGNFL